MINALRYEPPGQRFEPREQQHSEHVELVEAFLHIVRERTADQLDKWLNKVKDSHLPAFRPFVTGVQKDKEPILAGLTLSWSIPFAGWWCQNG